MTIIADDWSHEPSLAVAITPRMRALHALPPPPLRYTRPVVITLQPGELWCVKCGESWPAGTDYCTRCKGSVFVEARDVLRDGECW
jgi:predicted amidophosphoribosyltransferase